MNIQFLDPECQAVLSELHLCCSQRVESCRVGAEAEPTSIQVPSCKMRTLDSNACLNPPAWHQFGPAGTCFLRLGTPRAVPASHPDHMHFAASAFTDSQDRNEWGRGSTLRRKTREAPISTRRASWVEMLTPLMTIFFILGESLHLSKTVSRFIKPFNMYLMELLQKFD